MPARFRGRSSVVEHLLCKQGAVGSIPTVSILFGLVFGSFASGVEWLWSFPWGRARASARQVSLSGEGPQKGLSWVAVLFDR